MSDDAESLSSLGPAGTCDIEIRHATTVDWHGTAALIEGPSGTGKSALALALLAFGARLVADDRTCLQRSADGVIASAPPGLPALIEARGIGLLPVHLAGVSRLSLVVRLGDETQPRLPPQRHCDILGCSFPLIVAVQNINLAPAVLQLLKGLAEDARG